MMRLRVLLLVSLGINVALAGALWYAVSYQSSAKSPRTRAVRSSTNAPPRVASTNGIPRRQNLTWREIESSDYFAYITNLRAIGCPESTIRDIIVADVNALYDRKRAEITPPEQQWWRAQPEREALEAAEKQFAALDAERRALLTRLLGPNWESFGSEELVELNAYFDGPILGALSIETKRAVQEIERRSAERAQAFLEAQERAGRPATPADLARLRLETRNELAKILNPQPLEEYLLRYSQTAADLRTELRGLDVKPEEFRNLFRAREALDLNAAVHYSGNDPASIRQRELIERQREDAMKQVLGPDRYAIYRYARDPLFNHARTSVEQIGAPAETVLPLFQVNQAAEEERQRIQSDPNLSLEERALALANMVRQQQESLRRILGDAAYERYQQTLTR